MDGHHNGSSSSSSSTATGTKLALSSIANAGGIMRVMDQRALNATASLSAAAVDAGRVRPGGVAHASFVQSLTGGRNINGGGVGGSSSSSNSGTKPCSLPNSSHATILDESEKPHNTGRWSDDEHQRFLDGLAKHGTGNWKKITEMVGTRTCTQVRTHSQKYHIALQKPNGGDKAKKGSATRKQQTPSKLLIGGETPMGGYGDPTSPFFGSSSPSRGTHGSGNNGVSKRRKLRLTSKGSPNKDSSNDVMTGIEALARAAETERSHEEDQYNSLDDAAAGDSYDNGSSHHDRRKRPFDADGQPPYEDESDIESSGEQEGGGATGESVETDRKLPASTSKRVKKEKDESGEPPFPSRGRTVQRTSSMIGAATSIAALANAPVSSSAASPQLSDSYHVDPASSSASTAAAASAARYQSSQLQELEHLRERVQVANQTILSLQQQNRETEIKFLTALEEKNRAVADCKTLQGINSQLSAEHHRALIMLEHSQSRPAAAASSSTAAVAAATAAASSSHQQQQQQQQQTAQQAAQMEARLAQDPQIIAAAAANGVTPQELARHHRQQHEHQQNMEKAHLVELLHSQLTEAELRFHQVTESLTRQTAVLTDQHRAILELNDKLEKEKAMRQALEMELSRVTGGSSAVLAAGFKAGGAAKESNGESGTAGER